MKKILLIIFCNLLLINALAFSQKQRASNYTIDLARSASKELFGTNGVAYLQPMVVALNSTSNSGFYNTAIVPKMDFYVKFGLHGMFGLVRESDKNFTPIMPVEEFNLLKLTDFISFTGSVQDTSGLILYLFKTIVYDGIQQNRLLVPKQASTVLGGYETKFDLPDTTLNNLALERVESVKKFLPASTQKLLDSLYNNLVKPVISDFPSDLKLPRGGNLSSLMAMVPQLEIGSLFGTELLLRGIPPIDLGEYVGEFAFWGIGLKHCLSQWLPKEYRYVDLAVQGVYQGTNLKNEVGLTKAKLNADATIWNGNVHISKRFENIFNFKGDGPLDIYTGISYDQIDISASYKYVLPIEAQWKLGMLQEGYDVPTPGYPGDTVPQTSYININEYSTKWTIGFAKQFGPAAIFFDLNISKFSILQGGLEVRL